MDGDLELLDTGSFHPSDLVGKDFKDADVDLLASYGSEARTEASLYLRAMDRLAVHLGWRHWVLLDRMENGPAASRWAARPLGVTTPAPEGSLTVDVTHVITNRVEVEGAWHPASLVRLILNRDAASTPSVNWAFLEESGSLPPELCQGL